MISLIAKIRDKKDKLEVLRKGDFLPAVLYGEGIENALLQVGEKEFLKVFEEAGETSIVSLNVAGKNMDVLIHQIAKNPVNNRILHVDFFHPSLKKKIEAEIPLVFEGKSEAVESLGGVLMKEIQSINVKGLARDLPKEIIVDISQLKTFEDRVSVKNLNLPQEVEIIGRHPEDFVAHVALPKEEEIKAPQPVTEGEGEAGVETPVEKKEGEKAEK
ncbi:MAG: 50S ribosomal protein L25 [Candidatus Pacebacteria bacterium]|nr:50S ribosomal protein L25 [Candidatus Paceibacterota bacterium]